jgi:hypothetical protein
MNCFKNGFKNSFNNGNKNSFNNRFKNVSKVSGRQGRIDKEMVIRTQKNLMCFKNGDMVIRRDIL